MSCRSISKKYIFLYLLMSSFLLWGWSSVYAVPVSDFVEITDEAGFGSGLNKYSWSSTVFNNDLYIGTFNVNLDFSAIDTYINQIELSPLGELAELDAFRRLWSGSPVTPSSGGEIWRYSPSTSTWDQVLKTGAEDVGFREMIEYNGYIYAGTANGPNGPPPTASFYGEPGSISYDPAIAGTALYRSSDGVNWDRVSDGPFDVTTNPTASYNSSNRTMAVIDGKLWLGTENVMSGPELWSYDGANWVQEYRFPATGGISSQAAIGEIAEYNGQVYIGTWGDLNKGGNFSLFKLDPVTHTVQDVTPVYGAYNGNEGVMQLFDYKGNFYLGTVNYDGGFTLMRTTDPSTPGAPWEVITTDGFESEFPGGSHSNAYTWSTQVIDGVLYLGTFNINADNTLLDMIFGSNPVLDELGGIPDGLGQIWYTEDGLNWHLLNGDGLGNPFNYGFRTMNALDGQLVVGSGSNMFIPDIFSLPYDSPEALQALLAAAGIDVPLEVAQLLATALAEGEPFLDGLLPYIGTHVYTSQASPDHSVPEPATLLLLGSGLLGLAVFRKLGRK